MRYCIFHSFGNIFRDTCPCWPGIGSNVVHQATQGHMCQSSQDKNWRSSNGIFYLVYHILLLLHARVTIYSARHKTTSTIKTYLLWKTARTDWNVSSFFSQRNKLFHADGIMKLSQRWRKVIEGNSSMENNTRKGENTYFSLMEKGN